MDAIYAYEDPGDWVRVPEDIELTKKDCIVEMYSRFGKQLFGK
jgi:hypothetical protein